ncbi:MAG: T9SS type A sorting domain-containing protein [Saprospiraceae bacterium]
MKKTLTIILFFITGLVCAQTVNGSIEYTSSNTLRVTYTNTGVISGNSISTISVWIRLLNTNTTNTTVAVSGSNSFNLALAGASNAGTNGLYRFSVLSTLTEPNNVFPLNTPVVIADFTISGTIIPTTAELMVVSGFSNGTCLVIDNSTNALIWPGGTGLRPMDTALPIRLQSFTAKKFAANTSLLEWTTASEENASHIEIERSMDAKSWSYVATEKARGSLNYNTDYSFVDAEAVLQRDRFTTVYYRLKLVDNDGSSEYSEVRSVTFDNNGIVSLEAYPNPSTEVINLRMAVGETNTNTAQMMMLDMTGKLVKKQTVSANGISVLEVDQLETGVYNIIVKHEDKTYQKRVIKTN